MIRIKNLLILLIISVVYLLLSACSENKQETSAEEKSVMIKEVQSSQPTKKDEKTTVVSNEHYTTYNVSLDVDFQKEHVVGIERIVFTNVSNRNLEEIKIHVPLKAFEENSPEIPYFHPFEESIFGANKDKTYANISFGNIEVKGVQVAYDFSGTILTLYLDKAILPETQAEIILPFEADIPLINHRTGGNRQALWFGNFLPTLAVNGKADWIIYPYYPAGSPFFTETSNYTVKITTPKDMVVVGTGDEQTVEITEEQKTTTLVAKFVRDFAFAISSYYKEDVIETDDGIRIHLLHTSPLSKSRKENILGKSKEAMEYLNAYIGKYPYANYYMIETELFLKSGFTYGQVSFIDSARMFSKEMEGTIIHEMVHQWFSNVVGSNAVENAWLCEGFANYFTRKIMVPTEELDALIVETYDQLNDNIKNMSLYTMNSSLDDFTDWSDYYVVETLRPLYMLYSLENYLGEENFQKLLQNYYSHYAFQIATPEDFFKEAEKIKKAPMDDFFTPWIENKFMPRLYKNETEKW